MQTAANLVFLVPWSEVKNYRLDSETVHQRAVQRHLKKNPSNIDHLMHIQCFERRNKLKGNYIYMQRFYKIRPN